MSELFDQQNVKFIRYRENGEIFAWGDCQPIAYENMDGLKMLGEGTIDTHWVSNGEVLEKTPCPAILDGLFLRDVPVPAIITIDGVRYETSEPVVELTFNLPGIYTVTIESIPHLPISFMVTHEDPA